MAKKSLPFKKRASHWGFCQDSRAWLWITRPGRGLRIVSFSGTVLKRPQMCWRYGTPPSTRGDSIPFTHCAKCCIPGTIWSWRQGTFFRILFTHRRTPLPKWLLSMPNESHPLQYVFPKNPLHSINLLESLLAGHKYIADPRQVEAS